MKKGESRNWVMKASRKPKNTFNSEEILKFVGEANEEQVDRFIEKVAQGKPKSVARTRKQYGYWIGSCVRQLKNGKPVQFNGRFINPPKLDISSITKKGVSHE